MRRKPATKPAPVSSKGAAPDPFANCERIRLTPMQRTAVVAAEGEVQAALVKARLVMAEVKAAHGLPNEAQALGVDTDGRLIVRMKPA